jgi:IclR family mhp operon transcriptional activator
MLALPSLKMVAPKFFGKRSAFRGAASSSPPRHVEIASMSSFHPVRSIQRALAVLRVISESGPITVSDIVSACRLPQPTVVRIVETLIASGYIYREEDKATYKVTGNTLALSRGFDPHRRLVELATPLIDDLHLKIGWPSNLAVFDIDAMVIIHSNRALLGLSMPGRIGARIPMLATGVGIVTLSSMAPDERRAVLQRAQASNNRWDRSPRLFASLEEKIRKVKRDGHGFADEEYLDAVYQSRIWAVAVSVDVPSGLRVALSSLVLRQAGDRRRLLAGILPHLNSTATEIGRLLRGEYHKSAPTEVKSRSAANRKRTMQNRSPTQRLQVDQSAKRSQKENQLKQS